MKKKDELVNKYEVKKVFYFTALSENCWNLRDFSVISFYKRLAKTKNKEKLQKRD